MWFLQLIEIFVVVKKEGSRQFLVIFLSIKESFLEVIASARGVEYTNKLTTKCWLSVQILAAETFIRAEYTTYFKSRD